MSSIALGERRCDAFFLRVAVGSGVNSIATSSDNALTWNGLSNTIFGSVRWLISDSALT